ncbi:MAG: hypothetical protein MR906_01300 [Clostridium sp.]|nr:hypothetical protein [Clostridium sp.]
MFISKKKFDEAIKNAKEEVYKEVQRREFERDREQWTNDRFNDMDRRMSKAFGDIDRRLTELEKRNEQRNDIPVCPKY